MKWLTSLIAGATLALTAVSTQAQAPRETPPIAGTPKPFALAAVRSFALPNGLEVTMAPYGITPKVAVRLVIRTGNKGELWMIDGGPNRRFLSFYPKAERFDVYEIPPTRSGNASGNGDWRRSNSSWSARFSQPAFPNTIRYASAAGKPWSNSGARSNGVRLGPGRERQLSRKIAPSTTTSSVLASEMVWVLISESRMLPGATSG